MLCEKCWGEAWSRSLGNGKSQIENYFEIVREKDEAGTPCTPEEQRGEEKSDE